MDRRFLSATPGQGRDQRGRGRSGRAPPVYVAAARPTPAKTTPRSPKVSNAAGNRGSVYAGGFAQLNEDAFLNDFAGGVDPARARVPTRSRDGIARSTFLRPQDDGAGVAVQAGPLVRRVDSLTRI